MHKSPAELIKKLMQLGVLATINQEIDSDTATILAGEFGYEVVIKLPVDIEAMLMQERRRPALLGLGPVLLLLWVTWTTVKHPCWMLSGKQMLSQPRREG